VLDDLSDGWRAVVVVLVVDPSGLGDLVSCGHVAVAFGGVTAHVEALEGLAVGHGLDHDLGSYGFRIDVEAELFGDLAAKCFRIGLSRFRFATG
jgi:hypothetical protein